MVEYDTVKSDPQVIIAAFTQLSPARGAARRLLATGPLAGACWGTALITGRAWTWPIPLSRPASCSLWR